jgi:threonine/homoserine/homoserine lactone efflux protein
MTAITPQLFVALALFAFVSSITPGPNNTMLLASGANFGLRRTVPHLTGVMVGFFVLILCVGLGLGGLFAAYPVLHTVLKVLGGLYLLYLAFKIATADGVGGGKTGGKPQTFWQAAAFQWINPKAWAMALGAVTTYAPQAHYVANVVIIAAVFAAINIPCVTTWAAFGMGLRRFLDRPKVLRAFNLIMAALLVLSLYPIVAEFLPR